jgi:hypothetical protein
MKKLNITWDGVPDSTGFLFSFAKSLACAVKNSPWSEYTEDIVASSGFAFRMWMAADFCLSATSIWEFRKQHTWTASGGFDCAYTERLWGEDAVEEERRLAAIAQIKRSIDNGIPAISWDIGVPEWGLIIGYDDETATFATLSITGEGEMPYALLGKRELPIMSVLTITGKTDKPQDDIMRDTMKLAFSHLRGEEWCENNASGLNAYPALIKHFECEFVPDAAWQMEYFLGTYGALKEYAWKYFSKYGQAALSGIYAAVFKDWSEAFRLKTQDDITSAEVRGKIAALLKDAWKKETEAAALMEKLIK